MSPKLIAATLGALIVTACGTTEKTIVVVPTPASSSDVVHHELNGGATAVAPES